MFYELKIINIFSIFVDLAKYRPVYAPKDFLEVLLTLAGPEKESEWFTLFIS